MPIQFVGYNWSSAVAYNSTVSLTSLTGGIDTAARTGDLVIGVIGYGDSVGGLGWDDAANTGFANAFPYLHPSSFRQATLDGIYKIMGATPDTQVQYDGTNTGASANVAIVTVWRGCSRENPLDVTSTTATSGTAARPDPPSITPSTAGCVILAAGDGSGDGSPQAMTTSANMEEIFYRTQTGASISCVTGISKYTGWTSGAFDPDAWTGGETTTNDSWAAATMVLRPQPPIYYEVAMETATDDSYEVALPR